MDLAPEGCALVLGTAIPVDSLASVQLPDWLMDTEDAGASLDASTSGSFAVPCGPVPARVVYSKQLRTQRWRHGLAFDDLNQKQDLWVRSLYMSLQRQEVNQSKRTWEGEPEVRVSKGGPLFSSE